MNAHAASPLSALMDLTDEEFAAVRVVELPEDQKRLFEWLRRRRYEAHVRGFATNLYAIQQGDGGPVKIGLAKDPKERLRTLQCGNPEPLRIIAAWRTFPAEEKLIHLAFAEYRLCGEWFQPNPDLIDWVLWWGYDWDYDWDAMDWEPEELA